MKVVAITGASGFIGRHLATALAQSGVRVRALGRGRAPLFEGGNIEAVVCDIRKPDSLRGVLQGAEAIVHSAALVGGASAGESEVYKANVDGTRNLLAEASYTPSLRRFVHLSSVAVMGCTGAGPPIHETDPPHPRSIYGRTKLESEREVRHAAGDFDRVILRPMWVYGRDSLSTRKLIRNIVTRRMLLIGDAANAIQPVHIDDMIEAIRAALLCPEGAGETLQVAGPETMTTREMCRIIAHVAGAVEPKLHVPVWLARALATMTETLFARSGRKLPIDHDKCDFFEVHHAYSVERARAVLNWRPSICFAEGIRRTLAEFPL